MANRVGQYWDSVIGPVPTTYIDMGDGTWALRTVAVNPDGTPITAGASANVAKATAADPTLTEGASYQLSVDLSGHLRTVGGGGGGGGVVQQGARDATAQNWLTDPSDRAGRLVGVVYGSQAAQLQQTVTNLNLRVEEAVGGSLIDPRSIRALTSSDQITIANASLAVTKSGAWPLDTAAKGTTTAGSPTSEATDVNTQSLHARITNASLAVTGTFWQATQPVSIAATVNTDPVDRAARLLGVVDKGKVWDGTNIATVKAAAIAVNADNPLVVTIHPLSAPTTAQPVTGTFWQATQPVSIAAAVDVSDRAARLVGVVYGSQAAQLKQTATNFNAQVEVAVGATLIDPRSIRALTSADVVTAAQGTAAAASAAWPVKVTDGTSIGAVKAASVVAVAADPAQVVQHSPQRADAANLHITATAAVNTAATATLPAAGAGLFHYIVSVQLVKLYSVVGVAAGAGVIVTSTNLPGNPAWTTEQLASAAGTATTVINYQPTTPLKSSVANTATTFVAPLQLQTIWRWNVSYYTAP